MIRNYFRIALRNLWKHKSFTAINSIGLLIAFGASLLLSLTAFHELSYDRFHSQAGQLYQVYFEEHHPDYTEKSTTMPMPLTPGSSTSEMMTSMRLAWSCSAVESRNSSTPSLTSMTPNPTLRSAWASRPIPRV